MKIHIDNLNTILEALDSLPNSVGYQRAKTYTNIVEALRSVIIQMNSENDKSEKCQEE